MAEIIRISQDSRKPWIRYLGVPMGNDLCHYCKEAIEKINMREFDAGNVVIIRPDFNAFGILTHFHIELTEDPLDSPINNRENVAAIRHIKEIQRIEREAEEDNGEGVSRRALKFARKIGTRQQPKKAKDDDIEAANGLGALFR